MWRVHTEGTIRHIWPDDEQHDLDSLECYCHPVSQVLETGDILVVHNSFDGREYMERLVDPDTLSAN